MNKSIIAAALCTLALHTHAAELSLAEMTGLPESTPFALGSSIYAAGTGDIWLTYLGSEAHDRNRLWFDTDVTTPDLVLDTKGPGQASVGQTFNLGSFAAGTELAFGLKDRSTNHLFLNTGLFYLNGSGIHADVQAHSKVWFEDGYAYIGFEDRTAAQIADWDYNDLVFKINNVTPVPEAETWAMLSMGLMGVALARRRKQA